MPITQDRMLALIDAADDYRYALEGLIEQIETIRAAKAANQDYREAIAFLLQPPRIASMLHDPVRTATTLATERAHFKAAKNRNIRHADYLRRKRAGDSAAIMTDDQAAFYAELTGTAPPAQPIPQPRQAPLQHSRQTPPKPSGIYAQYNPQDDGDPEDAPAAQHFTGLDFVEPALTQEKVTDDE